MGDVRTLALVLEYDGTNFHGFARQAEQRTVAGELESALAVLLGHEVVVACAGRTDAGVHATGQVVSLVTNSVIAPERIPVAASALLRGKGIAVLRAVEREPNFSAWRDAVARTYRYRIINRPAPSPLHERRALWTRARLDLGAIKDGASRLVGEHDFAAFCGSAHQGPTMRTITVLEIDRCGDFIDLRITAGSFLHQMVRIIVGTLIEIGRGKRVPSDVDAILSSRDRTRAGFTAPAHGLYLERVDYAFPP